MHYRIEEMLNAVIVGCGRIFAKHASAIERLSGEICESCGSIEGFIQIPNGFWYKTLCKECGLLEKSTLSK